MRTENQIYARIRQLEGLKQGLVLRKGMMPTDMKVIKELNESISQMDAQIGELFWCIDEICPKCGNDDIDYDIENYYCLKCKNVWKWRKK